MKTRDGKTEKARYMYQRDMCVRKPKIVSEKAIEAFRRPAYAVCRKEIVKSEA